MIFKDRQDAGRKLLVRLFEDQEIKKNKHKVVIVSLLRGGIVVGDIIAKGLQVKHLPLVVSKIPAPHNPELALGALCFDVTYLEKNVVNSLGLIKAEIVDQIGMARKKFNSYLKRFGIKESLYSRSSKNKIVILTDDGIATGSTVKAAILFLKSKKPKSIYLAIPVAPTDCSTVGIDRELILHKNFAFGAVSQFYEHFPQVEDEEVKKLLRN
ncbi:hypothetical protein A3C25_05055 [Candidatus Roizmanbacteria bacterium RIFCSPHIGHO2_02_FULL_38_11]|uniref:Phosphoribosyltransferase domain-containing protein n=1 Tax=Candidatus Roizmanbacteria bacterium RIFCSPHIGHO2_02_FULL_38_11 TaxID=1802039 RepID=A0A1F7GYX2_9BACT|nr:MAG: hypothetical protein A3C25_05055 [Candidatus Roizmanbacteria bacterium RIFCSPHIGHO2_02_FULL_38_11]